MADLGTTICSQPYSSDQQNTVTEDGRVVVSPYLYIGGITEARIIRFR